MIGEAFTDARTSGWVIESRPKTKAPGGPTPALGFVVAGTPTPWDVVCWLQSQGIMPLPCKPKTKEPIPGISSYAIYGKGAPPGDSFHVPTSRRLSVVRAWWKNEEFHREATVKDESISVPLHPEWNNGQQVIVIDIDSPVLCDAITNAPYLAKCPVGAGKKGSKIFAFLDDAGGRPASDITQWYLSEDPGHPSLEVFAGSKHALIYGEHPDGTPEHPIHYEITRGFGEPWPVLSWMRIEEALQPIIRDYNLTRRTRPGRAQPAPTAPRHRDTGSITDQLHIEISNVCVLADGVKVGDEIQGSHPVHGSTGGRNFAISPRKNTWHCFRCNTGGGPLEWLAVESGLVDCAEVRPGCLEGRWPEVFAVLHARGYNADALVHPGKKPYTPFSSLPPEEQYLRRVEYRRRMRADRKVTA